MRKMSKREQALRTMQLCTDDKGVEYLFYHSAFGDVRDYSPKSLIRVQAHHSLHTTF